MKPRETPQETIEWVVRQAKKYLESERVCGWILLAVLANRSAGGEDVSELLAEIRARCLSDWFVKALR